MEVHLVEIDRKLLRRDGGTQPREKLDPEHIEDLVRDWKKGARFEPALVYYDGESYWLTDGYHRDAALEELGESKILVEIRSGTLEDAKWHSYSVNQHKALKRSNADKQRAIIGALKHPYAVSKSNVQIAEHCGVDEGTIRAWRKKLEENGEIELCHTRMVTRNGKTYSQNTTNIGSSRHNQNQQQKFKVNCPELPYHGQIVEVVEVKTGDCYQCRTASGDIYPFFKSELGDVNSSATPTPTPSLTIAKQPSAREKLVALVVRLPEECLEDAIALLKERFHVQTVDKKP
ncbi:ParB/RepB/Spo0J family partition protein [Tolypothrix campylonemoides VB511288]|nr:ParB/RepB/Spo0J family partition protein [Tolypothrix campylonemoides VB511288]